MTATLPKNLAQLKKFLQHGVKLKLVKAPYLQPHDAPLARKVHIVRTNSVTMIGDMIGAPNGAELTFLAAKFYQFDDKGFNACREIGGKMEVALRYEYVNE